VIPYTLFYSMLGAIANVGAAEQLAAYYAVLFGAGQVWSGEEGRSAIRRAVRELTALAYPEPPSDKRRSPPA
jgi:hypothetical protein